MPLTRRVKGVFRSFSEKQSTGTGKIIVDSEVELPELNEHDILISVKACGLSLINDRLLKDLFKKSGKQRFPVGQDVTGVVKEVGKDVTSVMVGDCVVGVVPLDYDVPGCAECIVLNEFDVTLKPDGVSFTDAAGCIGDAVKAYTALHYLARMLAGDTVLVLEGGSAFGAMCIQLAHHWGARVITTANTEDETQYLKELEKEIAVVIDSSQKNTSLRSVCMQETGGLGVDIVIDQGVNQYPQHCNNIYSENMKNKLPTKNEIISCLGVGGRWVTSKANLQLDPPNARQLHLRCASIGFLFPEAWMLSNAQQGRYQHILMDVMEKANSGTIRPNVHHTVPLTDIKAAIKDLPNTRVGKVVVTL